MATTTISSYFNDNDDFPVIERRQQEQVNLEQDLWTQEKKEIEALDNALKLKHRQMAGKLVAYVYRNLTDVAGFEVNPIYFDIPECRVTIQGTGKKQTLMYMVRLASAFEYSVTITPLTKLGGKEDRTLYVETPREAVDVLIATQRVYLS